MVQNMSVFICPNCNHSTHIFGSEGVARECEKHQIELLGEIPLHREICMDADRGKPTVASNGAHAEAYVSIAKKVSDMLF
jgi:ATP-binding protein involved in chromosome partitioning